MSVETPQVSVIIPAYNQAQFLASAIRSVLAQTYQNLEIIIVDDGSTDDTAEISQQFGNVVRYFCQENQGLAGARNTGIREARGKYVALLDSDDQWLPAFLQSMMSLTTQHPEATVYYCGVCYTNLDGHDLPQAATGRVVPAEAMYQAMLRGNFLVPSTIVMRRSTILAAGMFDPAFRRLQDWEFWLRLLRNGCIFAGTHACLVRYRLHDRSLTTDPATGQRAAMAIGQKLFGPDDEQWSVWNDEKQRAYGGIYRYCALMSLLHQSDWQACERYLQRALQIDPTIAADIDLFYELALGTQPPGYRGTTKGLDLESNASNIQRMLADIFRSTQVPDLISLRQQTYGTAYYALGLVAYNIGCSSLSRRFLFEALHFRPDLWLTATKILLRLFIGPRVINRLRELRSTSGRL